MVSPLGFQADVIANGVCQRLGLRACGDHRLIAAELPLCRVDRDEAVAVDSKADRLCSAYCAAGLRNVTGQCLHIFPGVHAIPNIGNVAPDTIGMVEIRLLCSKFRFRHVVPHDTLVRTNTPKTCVILPIADGRIDVKQSFFSNQVRDPGSRGHVQMQIGSIAQQGTQAVGRFFDLCVGAGSAQIPKKPWSGGGQVRPSNRERTQWI